MYKEGWCDYFDKSGNLLWTRKFYEKNVDNVLNGCTRNLGYMGAVEGVVYWGSEVIARINR